MVMPTGRLFTTPMGSGSNALPHVPFITPQQPACPVSELALSHRSGTVLSATLRILSIVSLALNVHSLHLGDGCENCGRTGEQSCSREPVPAKTVSKTAGTSTGRYSTFDGVNLLGCSTPQSGISPCSGALSDPQAAVDVPHWNETRGRARSQGNSWPGNQGQFSDTLIHW